MTRMVHRHGRDNKDCKFEKIVERRYMSLFYSLELTLMTFFNRIVQFNSVCFGLI